MRTRWFACLVLANRDLARRLASGGAGVFDREPGCPREDLGVVRGDLDAAREDLDAVREDLDAARPDSAAPDTDDVWFDFGDSAASPEAPVALPDSTEGVSEPPRALDSAPADTLAPVLAPAGAPGPEDGSAPIGGSAPAGSGSMEETFETSYETRSTGEALPDTVRPLLQTSSIGVYGGDAERDRSADRGAG